MTQQSQPMSPDEYLAQRLDDQIHWYDRKSQQNQKYFKRLRMIEITTAALIPVLAGRAADIPNFTLIVASLGSMSAITAGLMYLYRFE